MPGSGGFQVDLEALAGHEPEVRDVADKIQQAIDAAGDAHALGDINAFGLVGQVFAIPLQIWYGICTNFIKDLGTTGHTLADKVATAHQSLSTHEDNSKQMLAALGKELPS